jgi:hypothetical protein
VKPVGSRIEEPSFYGDDLVDKFGLPLRWARAIVGDTSDKRGGQTRAPRLPTEASGSRGSEVPASIYVNGKRLSRSGFSPKATMCREGVDFFR